MKRITKRIDADTIEIFPDSTLPAKISRFDDDMNFRMTADMFTILDTLCDYEDSEALTRQHGLMLTDDEKENIFRSVRKAHAVRNARTYVNRYFADNDDIVPDSIDYDALADQFIAFSLDDTTVHDAWNTVIQNYVQQL